MRSAAELAVSRRQTLDFIMADVDIIIVNRRTKVSDGAGGYTYDDVPQPPQQCRMILKRENTGVERRNVQGEMVKVDQVLLCEWNANVAVGDTFGWDGNVWEIVWITDMEYELVCEVAKR